MATIRLKDTHSEGGGGIIEVGYDELKSGTEDWISFSTSDEVLEEWEKQLKDDPISAIIECYEIEQGYESVDKIGLREFCENNS